MDDVNPKLPGPAKLVKASGFDAEFTALSMATGKSYVECFNLLNDIYSKAFGADRYSDYNSYRNTRARRLKRK
tara:strand:- start:3490 stop:3708 length:219 start_codon:yes stop_codon:yes gene_type:complete